MNDYQRFIHKSRYARYLPDRQRRETWEETVDRYVDFWIDQVNEMDIPKVQKDKILEELG